MKLYINGYDIAGIVFGDIAKQSVVRIEARPESYLDELNTFLVNGGYTPADIEAIYAVVGPGSPTALRAALAIVNTMGFVLEVPLYAVRQDDGKSDEDRVADMLTAGYESAVQLQPVYDRGTGVTISQKDQLGR